MTATATDIQFLYLIATGRHDGIYKIGISNDVERRLEQIKRDYDVPDAYIMETMDVASREEVFAIENALHTRYAHKRATNMPGREWFRLSLGDIKSIKEMYDEQSNSFAQAKAYYGLVRMRDDLRDKAEELEQKRQYQIRYNRSNGLTYDTKPKGALKTFNDLQRKIVNGTLGQRFTTRVYDHPAKKAVRETTVEMSTELTKHIRGYWWKVGLGGFFGALMVGAGTADPTGIAFTTGVFGCAAGGISAGNKQ